jgi:hypothetical protein
MTHLAMTYLVDGNNVMGQRVGWHRDKAGARRRLIGELARYVRLTGEGVDVVFDGAPDAGLFDGARVDGVGVHYAAPGSDADSRIRQLVEAVPDRHALTVVTSDRRLALRQLPPPPRRARRGQLTCQRLRRLVVRPAYEGSYNEASGPDPECDGYA